MIEDNGYFIADTTEGGKLVGTPPMKPPETDPAELDARIDEAIKEVFGESDA